MVPTTWNEVVEILVGTPFCLANAFGEYERTKDVPGTWFIAAPYLAMEPIAVTDV